MKASFDFLRRLHVTAALGFVLSALAPSMAQASFQETFPSATHISDSWYRTEGFGYVWSESFPWLYVHEQGWWYWLANDPGASWAYDQDLGWLWASPEIYPNLYSSARSNWLIFLERNTSRQFFNYWTGAQESDTATIEELLPNYLVRAADLAHDKLMDAVSSLSTNQFPSATASGNYATWNVSDNSDPWAGYFPASLWQTTAYFDDNSIQSEIVARTTALGSLGTEIEESLPLGEALIRAYAMTGDSAFQSAGVDAAAALANFYDTTIGALVDSSGDNPLLSAATLADLDLLFWGSTQAGGDSGWFDLAIATAEKIIDELVRADGSVYDAATFDATTGSRLSYVATMSPDTNSTWARGQALAAFGLLKTYERTLDTEFLTAGEKLLDFALSKLPPTWLSPFLYDESSASATPTDTSAAAVLANALIMAAKHETDSMTGQTYLSAAESILFRLVRGDLLARDDTTGALLKEGSLSLDSAHHGLILGDFFLFRAIDAYFSLLRGENLVAPDRVHGYFTEEGTQLLWDDLWSNRLIVAYRVYRDDTLVGETQIPYFVDAEAPSGTQSRYTITSVDQSGNESEASTAALVTTPPRLAPVYIDPENTNDSAADGSLEHPYSSLSKVTWAHGGTYLIKAGTTLNIGTSSYQINQNYITIGSYGEGPRPIVESESTGSFVFRFNGKNALLENLEVYAKQRDMSNTVYTRGENTTFRNLYVHGGTEGISSYYASGVLRVENCEVAYCYNDGMYYQRTPIVIVEDCYVHDVNLDWYTWPNSQEESGGDAIQLETCDTFRLSRNIFDRTSTGLKFCYISNTFEYGIVEFNQLLGSLSEMHAAYIGTGQKLVFRGNLVDGGRYGVWTHARDLELYNNIIRNQGQAGFRVDSQLSEVHHNIFETPGNSAVEVGNTAGINFRNNVFYNCPNTLAPTSLVKESYNCYYPSFGFNFRAADPTSFEADPLFSDPANDDYTPQAASPLIDAGGSFAGFDTDFSGHPFNEGLAPDIGIHEYRSVPMAPDTTPPTITGRVQQTATSDTTLTLAWDAAEDESGLVEYLLYRDGQLIAFVDDTSYEDTDLAQATTYGYEVVVRDYIGNKASYPLFLAETKRPVAATLPVEWTEVDIGEVGLPGETQYADGVFNVFGSGSDIYWSSDRFHYVYQMMSGDGEITARVVASTGGGDWMKSGLMIRNTLDADSPHALIAHTRDHKVISQPRLSAGATATTKSGTLDTPPVWLRLVRTGNTFDAYESTNGSDWSLVESYTIEMSATVYVGLAFCAYDNTVLANATFDNVSVTP